MNQDGQIYFEPAEDMPVEDQERLEKAKEEVLQRSFEEQVECIHNSFSFPSQ